MIFRSNIEIVAGFLGAGKTIFINALLENTLIEKEKVLIIQCEQGEKNIRVDIKEGSEVITKKYEALKPLKSEYLRYAINLYNPHRIIIEHNGSRNINELLHLLDKSEISKLCKLLSIYNIIDSITYELFLNNMGTLILDSIYNSNLIILNNTKSISEEKLNSILKQLEKFNTDAFIMPVSNITDLSAVLNEKNILYKGFMKKVGLYLRNQLSS
ncbi:GTP-binding protein [Clostridium sp. WILCCON 0269]|uniref:GTP-binding protein n=1 Tax=Candidatus Clostridium eludens TaxID=3381663 RepID=A0ABW8SLP4_9CLOT